MGNHYGYLGLAQLGFTLWMAVDAYRRGVGTMWLWIILFFQPLGAWVYFFVVKTADLPGYKLGTLFQRRESLDALRYRAEQLPTLANHLAYAERLIERRDYAAAKPHLEAALAREPEHCQVRYSLAVCERALGNPAAALPHLEKLIARDRRWSDYAAWHAVIEIRKALNEPTTALSAARELARLAPTLEHQCLLAELLLDSGQQNEAAGMLERALQDHHYAPGPIRRRNRAWAKQAQRLLKRVPSRAE